MKIITVNNIEIELHKKKIKNLHLRVRYIDSKVLVSAPKYVKEEDIRDFIISKMPWIIKQQERFKNLPQIKERLYITGETVFLWGKSYLLKVIHKKGRNNVYINSGEIVLAVEEDSTVEKREKILNNWYRDHIKKAIPSLIEKWQPVIGVQTNDWGVKNMKTRWGTCNVVAKRIWLNLQLTQKPLICLEYVVVHELVHLIEKKHDKAFFALMDRFLPNWRATKLQLKGSIYEY